MFVLLKINKYILGTIQVFAAQWSKHISLANLDAEDCSGNAFKARPAAVHSKRIVWKF